MKHIHIWIIILISLVVSPYLAHQIQATCTHENRKHAHRHVSNCTYSQKDLNRILAANKDRYCKYCEDQTCFYCGCPVADHSAQ
jgi:hypothetical protein